MTVTSLCRNTMQQNQNFPLLIIVFIKTNTIAIDYNNCYVTFSIISYQISRLLETLFTHYEL